MATATFTLETLQKENAEQRAEILYLKEQIDWFKRKREINPSFQDGQFFDKAA